MMFLKFHKLLEKITKKANRYDMISMVDGKNNVQLNDKDALVKIKREFIFKNILCPKCQKFPNITNASLQCKCGEEYQVVDSVPIFLEKKSDYTDRRNEQNFTNDYSKKCRNLIEKNPDAYILDFGCGNPKPENLFPNVVRLDFLHYPSLDIVSNCENLPFCDNTFDHVISQSVFEHVRDPWHYADELFRILKPGGQIIIDTAFLQPVHADPYHFFNMTLNGIEETFKKFEKVDSGVEPYQTAGFTMNILRNYYLEIIDDKKIVGELKEKIGDIDFTKYDSYIPKSKQHIMSAGVFFIGRKI